MAYIGIDVGTTGSKASVVEADGRTSASAYAEYDLRFPRLGWVEMRPSDVWTAVAQAVRQVATSYDGEIEAVAVASFGEAAVLLGADGEPVCDSIFYTDTRGSDMLDTIDARCDRHALALRTGMPVSGVFTLPKLLWLQKNRPGLLDSVQSILLYGSYIGYRLSGEMAIDASLASRSLMFSRETMDWDDAALEIGGIRRAQLPRFVAAGNVVGKLRADVASELGIRGTPVLVSGVHDQIAAALGAGALQPYQAADGVGSAECVSAVLPKDANLPGLFEDNICAEPHAVPGALLALAYNGTAGASLKWFRDTFEADLRDRLQGQGRSAYDELNARLSDEPSPVLFLPHMAGTGTPYMDATANGLLTGLTLATTKADIYRAILEGMNYEIKLNLDLLAKSGLRMNELTAVGGGASPAAMRIKADILQIPIHLLAAPQSGTVGMAMLCGRAIGRFASFEQAAEALIRRVATIEPRATHRDAYAERYERYRRLYEANRQIWE